MYLLTVELCLALVFENEFTAFIKISCAYVRCSNLVCHVSLFLR